MLIIKNKLLTALNKADDQSCLSCICLHESNFQPLECKWDDAAVSCGYFQVTSFLPFNCIDI